MSETTATPQTMTARQREAVSTFVAQAMLKVLPHPTELIARKAVLDAIAAYGLTSKEPRGDYEHAVQIDRITVRFGSVTVAATARWMYDRNPRIPADFWHGMPIVWATVTPTEYPDAAGPDVPDFWEVVAEGLRELSGFGSRVSIECYLADRASEICQWEWEW